MAARSRGFATLAIHGSGGPDPATGACTPPLVPAAAFAFRDAEHAARAFAGEEPAHIYSRLSNPTNAALEQRLARLEGGETALCTASGMAAIAVVLLSLCRAGDEVVAGCRLFGATHHLLQHQLARLGIVTRFVDPTDPAAWSPAINGRTRALYVETPSNPTLRWTDVGAVAELGRRAGVTVVVDNTLSTPYLFRPLEHGADVVVHSATKFLGGQGSAVAGAVVGGADFIFGLRRGLYQDLGPAMSPWHSYLLLLGLETLSLRMERHCRSALELARWLQGHPAVARVFYPGLADHPDHALATRLCPRGYGGVLSFTLHGGWDAIKQALRRLRTIAVAANLGDTRSLIVHPATTTHSQLTAAEQLEAGISADLVRLSVGLEDVGDLTDDLDRALQAAMEVA